MILTCNNVKIVFLFLKPDADIYETLAYQSAVLEINRYQPVNDIIPNNSSLGLGEPVVAPKDMPLYR